jgi:hypothetical protein
MTKTVLIIAEGNVTWVPPLAEALHDHGMNVDRMNTLTVIGFLLASRKIAAVVLDENSLPSDWETTRERMIRISPSSKFVVVSRDDQRSPLEIARAVTAEWTHPTVERHDTE